jgi:hypothetical protein
VLVQPPNALLTAMLAAALAARALSGRPAAYASALFHVVSSAWAYDELVGGVNWFRRLLGAALLLNTASRLARVRSTPDLW